MAKTRKQLSSPLFLGEMESLYQRSQMKPQAKFVGGVVVEQDYSTFYDSKHSFYIFASTSEYNFERMFINKETILYKCMLKIF